MLDSSDDACPICLDSVGCGGSVQFVRCGHWLHKECFKKFCVSNELCPLCRTPWRNGLSCCEDVFSSLLSRHPSCLVSFYDERACVKKILRGDSGLADLDDVFEHVLRRVGVRVEECARSVIRKAVKNDSVFGLSTVLETSGLDVFLTPSFEESEEETAIFFASFSPSPLSLLWLLNNVPYTPSQINESLSLSLSYGNFVACRVLLSPHSRSSDIDLAYLDEEGEGLLFYAIRGGSRECMSLLFSSAGVEDIKGFLSIYPSSCSGDIVTEITNSTRDFSLLRDVVSHFPFDPNSALHSSIFNWDDPEVVTFLITKRADANASDTSAPLSVAMSRDFCIPTVRLLLTHGARVTKEDIVFSFESSTTFLSLFSLLVSTARLQKDRSSIFDSDLAISLVSGTCIPYPCLEQILDEPSVQFDSSSSSDIVGKCSAWRHDILPSVFDHPKVASSFPLSSFSFPTRRLDARAIDTDTLEWFSRLSKRTGRTDILFWPSYVVPSLSYLSLHIPITFPMFEEMMSDAHAMGERLSPGSLRCADAVSYLSDEVLTSRGEGGISLLHISAAFGNFLVVRSILRTKHGLSLVSSPCRGGRLPVFHANTCSVLSEFKDFYESSDSPDANYFLHRDKEGTSLLGFLLGTSPDSALMLARSIIPPSLLPGEMAYSSPSHWVGLDMLLSNDDRLLFLASSLDPNSTNFEGVSLLAGLMGKGKSEHVSSFLRSFPPPLSFRLSDAIRLRLLREETYWDDFRTSLSFLLHSGYQLTPSDLSVAKEAGLALLHSPR